MKKLSRAVPVQVLQNVGPQKRTQSVVVPRRNDRCLRRLRLRQAAEHNCGGHAWHPRIRRQLGRRRRRCPLAAVNDRHDPRALLGVQRPGKIHYPRLGG